MAEGFYPSVIFFKELLMIENVNKIPTIALNGVTILPEMKIHFDVSKEKSKKAIAEAMLGSQQLFVVTKKQIEIEGAETSELYDIGTIVEINQTIKLPKDDIRVMAKGLAKASVVGIDETGNYLVSDVELIEQQMWNMQDEIQEQASMRALLELFYKYMQLLGKMKNDIKARLEELKDINEVLRLITANLVMPYTELQIILEITDNQLLYDYLTALLAKEIQVLRIKIDIESEVSHNIDENQRNFVLREHMKVIQKVLGDDDASEEEEFQLALDELEICEEVRTKIQKELNRYKKTSPQSAEKALLHNYVETMLEIPWNERSEDNRNLKSAKKVLDADHYGLEDVKERILDYLAVQARTTQGDTPIICLVGPPGTGKTSIAKSLATAMGKEYVRISLGGVRDEAEIRGHRKTYIGAMPGRIASGMKLAGTRNPLMLLDEIDKVSNDYKGDTFSALLEVLDGEQNHKFRDHYLEVPLDLSEVLFVATANTLETIPRPLLDRMEVIEIQSYTENEKAHIAKCHLIPKQLKLHGLSGKELSISKAAVEKICHGYTKEAGVRGLEKRIGDLCRKSVRELSETGKTKVRITETNLEKYLGKERYTYQLKNDINEIGIVRGLAWTKVGGVTLQIEVNVMRGKGSILLTGQLGGVMKESAQTGVSYIRSIGQEYDLEADYFEKHDIHIHIPEGAVPKDGPSAGITMATAILSAVTDTEVRADVAMTGEITLRGRVLQIGGLKEKLLAAKYAGIKTVIVPNDNQKDIAEISDEIKEGLEIIPVKHMSEVCDIAFV